MSSQTSCFQQVVLLEIPDLELIDHFPILTAVIGILLALLKEDMAGFTRKYDKRTLCNVIYIYTHMYILDNYISHLLLYSKTIGRSSQSYPYALDRAEFSNKFFVLRIR